MVKYVSIRSRPSSLSHTIYEALVSRAIEHKLSDLLTPSVLLPLRAKAEPAEVTPTLFKILRIQDRGWSKEDWQAWIDNLGVVEWKDLIETLDQGEIKEWITGPADDEVDEEGMAEEQGCLLDSFEIGNLLLQNLRNVNQALLHCRAIFESEQDTKDISREEIGQVTSDIVKGLDLLDVAAAFTRETSKAQTEESVFEHKYPDPATESSDQHEKKSSKKRKLDSNTSSKQLPPPDTDSSSNRNSIGSRPQELSKKLKESLISTRVRSYSHKHNFLAQPTVPVNDEDYELYLKDVYRFARQSGLKRKRAIACVIEAVEVLPETLRCHQQLLFASPSTELLDGNLEEPPTEDQEMPLIVSDAETEIKTRAPIVREGQLLTPVASFSRQYPVELPHPKLEAPARKNDNQTESASNGRKKKFKKAKDMQTTPQSSSLQNSSKPATLDEFDSSDRRSKSLRKRERKRDRKANQNHSFTNSLLSDNKRFPQGTVTPSQHFVSTSPATEVTSILQARSPSLELGTSFSHIGPSIKSFEKRSSFMNQRLNLPGRRIIPESPEIGDSITVYSRSKRERVDRENKSNSQKHLFDSIAPQTMPGSTGKGNEVENFLTPNGEAIPYGLPTSARRRVSFDMISPMEQHFPSPMIRPAKPAMRIGPNANNGEKRDPLGEKNI
ncbi:hypothetical protein M501DRAFT_1012083 [Patellaria atrata CBS 101060]|uniref:Uncharacterized protein n=1 Tax=Patellaria atrata CBS 101060 TaxID=1346257 RepID=A0A9P4VR91_9PEZI|nr:hypothetical protein M501DRAFT_1012083 [Patellaria atrata CBS 101060]